MKFKFIYGLASAALAVSLLGISACRSMHEEPTTVFNETDLSIEKSETIDTPEAKKSSSRGEKQTSNVSSNINTESTRTSSDKKKPRKVIVSESELTLHVGETKYVAANVLPTIENVVWKSSNSEVASIDESGKLTAKKPGKCNITAEAVSDSKIKSDIKLTVKETKGTDSENSSKSSVPSQSEEGSNTLQSEATASERTVTQATGITLLLPDTTIIIGQRITPNIAIAPYNAEITEVTLSTSDTGVAAVNSDSSVTAVGTGTCTLTAYIANNKSISDSVTVTVVEREDITAAPQQDESPSEQEETETTETESEENIVTTEEDETVQSTNEYPTEELYLDGILIVNKTYSLPRSYNPGGLTAECSEAFSRLKQGAAADGISIWLASGFRSYDYQEQLYNGYVYYYGQAATDTFSARPGHSEHQTGLAIDCNIIEDRFAGTPEAIWLEEHCHEYGFIIRYPQGKQDITGYKYEPWHIRYIGDKAWEIHDSGLTLEEYFGITSEYQ